MDIAPGAKNERTGTAPWRENYMEYKDYYKILGVTKNASKDEIQRAYRKLARKLHPDINKSPDAETGFKEINEAYEVLKDPEKRGHYDRYGQQWHEAQRQPPPGWDRAGTDRRGEPSSRTFHFGGGDFNFRETEFSDFFRDLFGDRGSGGPSGYDFQYNQPGKTHEAAISVNLADVYQGSTRTISFQTWEVSGSGEMQPRQRTLQVKIPRGVTNGSVIRLAGQGEKGSGSGAPGDLLLKIKIVPDPVFRVAGHDLYTTIGIAPWEAALGAKIPVQTVEGRVNLTIPPGTQSGKRFRLRGKGIPKKRAGAGDIIVTTQIRVPETLSAEEKALFEKLSERSKFHPRRKGSQRASNHEEV
jgi:curved DNA-binding protein